MTQEKTTAAFQKRFKRKRKCNTFNNYILHKYEENKYVVKVVNASTFIFDLQHYILTPPPVRYLVGNSPLSFQQHHQPKHSKCSDLAFPSKR